MEGVAHTAEPSDKCYEDNISSLPDSILLHILSFLPIEEAVKTVCHRRFGNLWTSAQTLNFDARAYNNFADARHRMWYTNFVSHVLLRYELPRIFKFSLKFGSYLYFLPKNMKPHRRPKPLEQDFSRNIDTWICFAIRKKVQVLDLGILEHESSSSRFDYDLPDNVLICDSLKELRLVNIGLKQQGKIHMKMLKSLSLTTIMLDDAMAEGLLSGCPLLETLSIIKCNGLRKLNCKSIRLKKLTVDIGEYELPKLEISGPNLTSVHITGIEAPVDLRNLLSLVEATLDICSGGGHRDKKHSYTAILLEKLHHANIFTVTNWCILLLRFLKPSPSSTRSTLVLNTMLTRRHLPGITTLLRSSPNLGRVDIYLEAEAAVRDDPNDLRLGAPGNYGEGSCYNESRVRDSGYEDMYLNSQEPFSCLINHLKYVNIYRIRSLSDPCLQALIMFLLGRSKVLEKMVISIYSSHSLPGETLKFSQMLSRCRQASDHAVFLVN